jgi:hypothetical protein
LDPIDPVSSVKGTDGRGFMGGDTLKVSVSRALFVVGITRSTPVLWEWLAFCSLLFWLITHALILGDARRKPLP